MKRHISSTPPDPESYTRTVRWRGSPPQQDIKNKTSSSSKMDTVVIRQLRQYPSKYSSRQPSPQAVIGKNRKPVPVDQKGGESARGSPSSTRRTYDSRSPVTTRDKNMRRRHESDSSERERRPSSGVSRPSRSVKDSERSQRPYPAVFSRPAKDWEFGERPPHTHADYSRRRYHDWKSREEYTQQE